MHEHPHGDTDTVIRIVRDRLVAVSHQAVYDVLRALTAADDHGFPIDEAEVLHCDRLLEPPYVLIAT